MAQDTLTPKQRRYRWLKQQGLCVECGKVAAMSGLKCQSCRDSYRKNAKLSRQRREAARKAMGKCVRCGNADAVTALHCENCREQVYAYQRRTASQTRVRRIDHGKCAQCGRLWAGPLKTCDICRQKASRRARARTAAIKQEVLAHYGGGCACCGETIPDFLTIDHVNGDGAEHRRNDPGAWKIHRWLKRRGFPRTGYQVLCMNCNWAKGRYGRCPHEDMEVENGETEQRCTLAPSDTQPSA